MGLVKKIFSVISIVLLIFVIYMSITLIDDGKKAKAYKVDYALLHSSEFGMLNSDIWTQKVIKILDHKIQKFDLNTNNREEIRGYIENIIDTLVLEAERVVRERNKGQRGFLDSILGSTKQMITDSIIDFKDLRKRVPEFTKAVLEEAEKPENQVRAKKLVREKLKAFMATKFTYSTDMTLFNNVLKKYHAKDANSCNAILSSKMKSLKETMDTRTNTILIIALVILLLVVAQGLLNTISLLVLSFTSVILLVSGVLLPMLDIEAKIDKLSFVILDTPIIFENQVLFFQSKSISDLVQLLLDSGEAKMILVGILLVMFSVIFPTLKLIATYLYYYSSNFIGANPVTRFFALKSTKWSMADVMVVSIFMAYLGLDGVVGNELKHLEEKASAMNVLTTNGSHLEVGFFLFLGFVLSSFVLSVMVEKKHNNL